MTPVYLHHMFSYTNSITGRVGRKVYRLFVPQIHTNFGLFYHGATLWNALSPALYDAASYTQIKSNYLRTI